MSTRLTVPTLQRTYAVKLPVHMAVAVRESAVQDKEFINHLHHRLLVPRVPSVAAEAIKKDKVSAKRWKDFNRQAARRRKPVALSFREYTRLLARPCFYCGTREGIGVDRVNNSESYTRGNSVPCCGTCNFSKRDFSLRDFIRKSRAVAKETQAFAFARERSFTI